MWNTYGDGSANPYDNEDCFRTLPLTDRHRLVSPDLAATMVVDRVPAAFDGGNHGQGYGYYPSHPDVQHPDRYADARRNEATYDNPGNFGNPGGPRDPRDPGNFYDGDRADFAPQRRPLGRRVLFAAGGLTLLGGLGVAAARSIGVGNVTRMPAAAPQGRPVGPAAATTTAASPSGHPSASPSTAPTHAANPVPSNTATTSANTSTQVQTAPEYYVHNGPKGIALTLDDGPTSEYTPQVLALLQRYGITATFCMIGRQIPPNAALVREVAAAGHAIVNHTWDHADQTKLTLAQVHDSMAQTSEALNDVGITPSIYRAPYGSWNKNVFQACADAGLRPLDWSVDPQDWARPGSATIVQRILKQTSTGSIILEHDGGGDRSQTIAALEVVLPELLNAGYRFGAV